MSEARKRQNLLEQAELIEGIVERCRRHEDRRFAGEMLLTLTAEDAEKLRALGARLRLMAPYQSEIARVVLRK